MTVFGVAFSPNSKLMVTGGNDGRAKVWTVGNGTVTPESHVFPGSGIATPSFSPDGTMLALGRQGGVEIWDVATWNRLRTLTIAQSAYGAFFSPDSTQVISVDKAASGGASTLYVHSVSNVTALHTASLTNAWALAVSPVSVGGGIPVAVSTTTGSTLVYNLTATGFGAPTTVAADSTFAETVAFSPTGDVLASGGDDGLLHFWNVPIPPGSATNGADINVYNDSGGWSDWVLSLAFYPSGNDVILGTGFFGGVGAWGASSRTLGSFQENVIYDVVSMAVSPDGTMIGAGEGDCGCVVVCPQ